MEKQVIKDNSVIPISVLIGLRDWVEIEDILARMKVIQSKGDSPDNPLDWYTLA